MTVPTGSPSLAPRVRDALHHLAGTPPRTPARATRVPAAVVRSRQRDELSEEAARLSRIHAGVPACSTAAHISRDHDGNHEVAVPVAVEDLRTARIAVAGAASARDALILEQAERGRDERHERRARRHAEIEVVVVHGPAGERRVQPVAEIEERCVR